MLLSPQRPLLGSPSPTPHPKTTFRPSQPSGRKSPSSNPRTWMASPVCCARSEHGRLQDPEGVLPLSGMYILMSGSPASSRFKLSPSIRGWLGLLSQHPRQLCQAALGRAVLLSPYVVQLSSGPSPCIPSSSPSRGWLGPDSDGTALRPASPCAEKWAPTIPCRTTSKSLQTRRAVSTALSASPFADARLGLVLGAPVGLGFQGHPGRPTGWLLQLLQPQLQKGSSSALQSISVDSLSTEKVVLSA